MKQYRLKITWSNGDSEYARKQSFYFTQEEIDTRLQAFSKDTYWHIDDNAIVFLSHARKIEFEEFIPSACFNCSKEFFLATTGRIARQWEIDANDRECAQKDPSHKEK
jgi:hypothetical protein